MTPAGIRVQDLTKRFGEHLAVDRASFDVPYGAVAGFVGGNGSGKTTTMRTLLGLSSNERHGPGRRRSVRPAA